MSKNRAKPTAYHRNDKKSDHHLRARSMGCDGFEIRCEPSAMRLQKQKRHCRDVCHERLGVKKRL
jgi:hypothetical protein